MRRNGFIPRTVSEDIGAASREHTSTTANFIYNPEYTKMMARVAYLNNREVEESYIEGSDYKKITMTVISDDEESLCPFKEKIKVNVEKKETKSAVKTSVCFENQLISKVSVHIRDVAFTFSLEGLKLKDLKECKGARRVYRTDFKKWLLERLFYCNMIWENIERSTIRELLAILGYQPNDLKKIAANECTKIYTVMNNVRGELYFIVAAKYRELNLQEVQRNPSQFLPEITPIIESLGFAFSYKNEVGNMVKDFIDDDALQ
ncbi:Hypothetical protein SRAE_X000237600 [Strongyloides ratti]|uniref:Uncharacterized protein n=1 Tax=Strongyloides ratti TaxID=34506 RepID=A0A090KXP9_STRRB|nr:Hypothetical protein SRAE_X000237600 [Strongyloides ratti]CEF60642.1 Hypothetical protein SRAE_X000237600 [Strongyloides ratti]